MDTYSVAPPSDGYDYVNTDPSSPYYMWDYKLGSTAHGEVEHVYGNGRTDWVPVGSPNISAASWAAPAGAQPLTIETGGVPGAPVIHAPAPSAPAPSAPAPSAPSAPAPTPPATSSIPAAITAEAQDIEKEIGSMSSSGSSEEIITEGKAITQQIQELQNRIYDVSGSGAIGHSQMQDLESQTVELGVRNIQKEESTLQQRGGVTTDDVQAMQQQYEILQENVRTLEARDALPKGDNTQGAMNSLEQQLKALSVSASSGGGSTGTGTPSPIGGTAGGTSGGGGSSSGGGGSSDNPNSPPSDGTTPPVIGGTLQPVTGSGSSGSDPTGGSAAPSSDSAAVSGATYTVVHGDTLSGIAASNNVSLSQLESLNPQIKDPNLIFPGENVNLGGGGGGATDSSTAPSAGGGYTVVHGDTLSGIAAANGMTTSQIEGLNPQIKDPNLIFPGENVNLGGGATASTATDSSQINPTEGPVMTTASSSPLPSTSDTSTSGGAIGFPEKSSYPFGTIGAEAEKALGETSANSQAAGWVTGSENQATDVAKQVFEADNHPSTDPLKINENRSDNSGH